MNEGCTAWCNFDKDFIQTFKRNSVADISQLLMDNGDDDDNIDR